MKKKKKAIFTKLNYLVVPKYILSSSVLQSTNISILDLAPLKIHNTHFQNTTSPTKIYSVYNSKNI